MTITTDDRRAVVAYALAQRGQPYLWLGAGPGGFDCSGLVLSAWARAGVILPHNSGAQAKELQAVPYTKASKSKLQLGDVIFYYGSPRHPESITHCALYVGKNSLGLKQVVAAVDETHGVMEHGMFWALAPCAFGYVGHGA
jgi:cell wall-associated NlpC family hydrolase